MNRQLETTQRTISSHSIGSEFQDKPMTWMIAQAQQYGFKYLLAYADNALIWGRFDASGLKTSGAVFDEVKAELSAETLQQARLFNRDAELMIWKNDGVWMMRLIQDGAGEARPSFIEKQWLWGTRGELGREADGFTLLVEGKQGLRHAPPIIRLAENERVALVVRHYIGTDDSDQAQIELSRLMDIEPVKGGK